jgi:hypothetical protein
MTTQERLKAAFEELPPDIPQEMKDRICDRADLSGSLVSRVYMELRQEFTGRPYSTNDVVDALQRENAELRKDAERYRWLRQYDVDSYRACGKLERLDSEIDAAKDNDGAGNG